MKRSKHTQPIVEALDDLQSQYWAEAFATDLQSEDKCVLRYNAAMIARIANDLDLGRLDDLVASAYLQGGRTILRRIQDARFVRTLVVQSSIDQEEQRSSSTSGHDLLGASTVSWFCECGLRGGQTDQDWVPTADVLVDRQRTRHAKHADQVRMDEVHASRAARREFNPNLIPNVRRNAAIIFTVSIP